MDDLAALHQQLVKRRVDAIDLDSKIGQGFEREGVVMIVGSPVCLPVLEHFEAQWNRSRQKIKLGRARSLFCRIFLTRPISTSRENALEHRLRLRLSKKPSSTRSGDDRQEYRIDARNIPKGYDLATRGCNQCAAPLISAARAAIRQRSSKSPAPVAPAFHAKM